MTGWDSNPVAWHWPQHHMWPLSLPLKAKTVVWRGLNPWLMLARLLTGSTGWMAGVNEGYKGIHFPQTPQNTWPTHCNSLDLLLITTLSEGYVYAEEIAFALNGTLSWRGNFMFSRAHYTKEFLPYWRNHATHIFPSNASARWQCKVLCVGMRRSGWFDGWDVGLTFWHMSYKTEESCIMEQQRFWGRGQFLFFCHAI